MGKYATKNTITWLVNAIKNRFSSIRGVTTSGDGAAYTATVDGINALEVGVHFMMIPHTTSTSIVPTLNVNELGAKELRCRLSSFTSATAPAAEENWIVSGKPVMVTYDGMFWIVDLTRPDANNLYGTIDTAQITDGAVTEAKIADGSVTTSKVNLPPLNFSESGNGLGIKTEAPDNGLAVSGANKFISTLISSGSSEATSSAYSNAFQIMNSDSTDFFASLQATKQTNGEGVLLEGHRTVNGTNKWNTLRLLVNKDGTPVVSVTSGAAWASGLGIKSYITTAGTSGNWKYVKFSDGMVILHYEKNHSSSESMTQGAVYSYKETTISFPFTLGRYVPIASTNITGYHDIYVTWTSSTKLIYRLADLGKASTLGNNCTAHIFIFGWV